jgi:ABC-type uncharacterized transport system permease subunit
MLVITTALVVLYAFVTTRTVIGRQIYAVGGSAKAAKLSGIKTERLPTVTAKRPSPSLSTYSLSVTGCRLRMNGRFARTGYWLVLFLPRPGRALRNAND